MMKCLLIALITLLISKVVTVFGANILLLPVDHSAHVNIFCIVGKALVNKGHKVHMVTMEKHRAKIIQSKINPILYKPIKAITFSDDPEFTARQTEIFFGGITPWTSIEFLWNVTQRVRNQTEEILQNADIKRQLKEIKFNLAIVDGSFLARALYALVYKYGMPYISLTTTASAPWEARVPAMPSVEPLVMFQYSNQMSFFQRLANYIGMTAMYNIKSLLGFSMNEIITKYVPEKPYITLDELYSKSEMFINNIDVFLMDYPRVSAPHFIYITGTCGDKAQPLNADLKEFVSSAENGIIVVSFGSIVKKLPLHITQKLFEVFSNLSKFKFVMRYSDDLPITLPDNVKIMKWLPQNDLLGHPKTKLFFTHGGTNGMMEAIFHGVPLVAAPIGGDHPYNAHKVEIKNYGTKTQQLI